MKQMKFKVDEITIGNQGDRSVGIAPDYNSLTLSDSLSEYFYDNPMDYVHFQKELFDLIKKYDDEVDFMIDDVEDTTGAVCELMSDMSIEDMKQRVSEIEEERDAGKRITKVKMIERAMMLEYVKEGGRKVRKE